MKHAPIIFKDRKSLKIKEELVYGEKILSFLYSENPFGIFLSHLSAKLSFLSKIYGWIQKLPFTKKKIIPFIKNYEIDPSEFQKSLNQFNSFNDFFIRKLKKEARPIEKNEQKAIIPADGRFLFYQDISNGDGFIIKGKKFCLEKLVGNKTLAKEYKNGSMTIGRLCPSDYHRFHFACDGTPNLAKLINGPLYSVNPISIKKNINLLAENKRMITEIDTPFFKKIIAIEVGATNVGSIHQTFRAKNFYKKGDEKGFFSFGGSALILLFQPDTIIFDEDLVQSSKEHIEMRCLMGQSMGLATISD
jgi:phosphatidylserine decarboxylase